MFGLIEDWIRMQVADIIIQVAILIIIIGVVSLLYGLIRRKK